MSRKTRRNNKVGVRGKNHNQILEDQLYFEKFIKGLSEREAIYLREQLCTDPEFVLVNEKSNVHQVLIESLAKSPLSRNGFDRFLAATEAGLVKESEFDWLRDSLRKQIFVYFILKRVYRISSRVDTYSEDLINSIISIVDYAGQSEATFSSTLADALSPVSRLSNSSDAINRPLTHDEKLRLISSICQIQRQVAASEKYTKWMDNNNEKEKGIHIVEWSYDYLRDKHKSLDRFYSPTTIEEKKEVVLAALDLFDLMNVRLDLRSLQKDVKSGSYGESADKILFIERMKKSWSQQKFRDAGKTKKPYHLPLTKIANARLDKMAEVQGTTSTAILDMLINVAYEQDYIDEHGKDKY